MMKKICKKWLLVAVLLCSVASVQAQVMKAADLEKYAKERYGDKWLDAAANLAKSVKFDKNESLTYQEVEDALVGLLAAEEDPTFSIYSDETVPVGEVVQIMNIAKRNHYKVILATQPE